MLLKINLEQTLENHEIYSTTDNPELDELVGTPVNGRVRLYCGVTELIGFPGAGKTQNVLRLIRNLQINNSIKTRVILIDTECSLLDTQIQSLSTEIHPLKLQFQRIFNASELSTFIDLLLSPQNSAKYQDVAFIAIDSISYPAKLQLVSNHSPSAYLDWIRDINQIGYEYRIPIIVTNTFTHNEQLNITPALGPSFSALIAKRIVLGNEPKALKNNA